LTTTVLPASRAGAMPRNARYTGAFHGTMTPAADIGMPLTVVADTLADGRAEYGSRLVLVRPDQHVAWAGDAPPDDLDGLIRMVAGRS
jgi:hypothetical protein